MSALPLIVRTELVKSGRFKTLADLKGLRFAEPGKGSANLPIVYRFPQEGRAQIRRRRHVFLPFPTKLPGMHTARSIVRR